LAFAIYYTLGAIVLYFIASWALDRIEAARGERFKHRNLVFFIIIFLLAYGFMYMVNPPPDEIQQAEEQLENTQIP